MSSRHVIVTGGAGFIGSYLAERLLAEGHSVTVIDDLSTGFAENVPEGARLVVAELGTPAAEEALESLTADAVFHLAGQSSGEASFFDPEKDERSHVASTLQVLRWCERTGCKRVLYSSSMAVYGDPVRVPVVESDEPSPKTYYAAAKLGAEAYLRFAHNTLGIDTTTFRLFSVYGPGQNLDNPAQGMVSIFLAMMLAGDEVHVKGSPDRFRDFTHVSDVVDAWMRAWDEPATFGKIYNLSTGVKTTVGELVGQLRDAWGDPDYPVRFEGSTPGDQLGMTGSSEKFAADTGWKPAVSVAQGVAAMVAAERAKTTDSTSRGDA